MAQHLLFCRKKKKIQKRKDEKTIRDIPKQMVRYSLDYIMHFFGGEGETKFPMYYSETQKKWLVEGENSDTMGRLEVWHDTSLNKWRLTVQLEPDAWWFLSVFFTEEGDFDLFSLDYEAADDSHYEFTDEEAVRRTIYKEGDESLYLHEIFIRYIKEFGKGNGQDGGFELKRNIPVTKSFFYY